jgi:hypothetical protein
MEDIISSENDSVPIDGPASAAKQIVFDAVFGMPQLARMALRTL